ncbi:hypothetical protein MtrunA17_Chr6g0481371 [Medicago truncatula]|uniref:Uncharacterized protein n=1 Tax=Medicago truncatula TaxID=3880 RepID=A0A396HIT6_MEDTR|nr:hypothetical protein MtrunA17_Chr6g0481371 [Medicago truncatula]
MHMDDNFLSYYNIIRYTFFFFYQQKLISSFHSSHNLECKMESNQRLGDELVILTP